MAKQYEVRFELNGDIDPRLSRTFDSITKDVTALGLDLAGLQRTKGLVKITRDANEAKGAFHELRQDAKEFGEVFERTLQFTGAKAIIDSASGMIGGMISQIGSLDDAVHQMGAATGATAQDMAQYKDIIQGIYNSNIGEGFQDIGDALVNVRQVTDLAGAALDDATKKALIMKDTFGYEVNESVRTVDALMRNMGLTADEAFNLIAQGTQKGLNRYDDLLDTLNEYSVQFADAGYNSEEFFSVLESGAKRGLWNLDKMGDILKEFNIRLYSGDDKVVESLQLLFAPEGVEEYIYALKQGGTKTKEYGELLKYVSKDTATELVKNLQGNARSYKVASQAIMGMMGDSDQLMAGLSDGSIKAKDAVVDVIAALDRIDDIQERNQLSVELFGTQYEDLRSTAVEALQDTNGEFDKTLDTMKEIEEVKYSSLTKEIQGLGRELMTELVIPIGEDLMPTLRDLTNWAKENKDVIKIIALGVPTALLAKNAVSIGRDFGKVGKTLFDTTQGASKFSTAIGFMTNPVGLAIGAVGALTLGVMAYKKHQEEARQELIHMGDALKDSMRSYDEVADKAKTTNDLVWEYKHLSEVIEANTGKSSDLTYQKEKLVEVTERLQELYPQTISQYDIENGKLDEKVNLLLRASDAEKDRMKLQLELQAAEGRRDMGDMEEQITSLESQTSSLREQKDALDIARAAFSEYETQYMRLMENDPSEERTRKLQELLDKANDVGETIGYSFGHLDLIRGVTDEIDGRLINTLDELQTKSEELSSAKDSYQAIYDAQKMLIELNLGGTIDEQSQKYKTLSDDGKAAFDRAANAVKDLNAQMDLIPSEKKINIVATYQTIGKLPTTQDIVTKLNGTPMKQYADGGIAKEPSIFGEAGPEIAIPLNNKPRSQGLLDEANRIMGRDSGALAGSSNISIAFSPSYSISGGDRDQVKAQVVQAQTMGINELESMLRQLDRRNQRRSLVG
ncbi:phage tail tape measure protein [Paenibacillus sp. E222]|uniref:phage tail tape measure protein n=1 Tax=Paenibacillus sp. E222 TaxID=2748863 RepID=UPI0015C5EFCB|nr:phage tail tape measure protein [Paenibacillus sp. E222]QLG39396.1 phage tail tape measure protein [Paenibacillus sp. E222]